MRQRKFIKGRPLDFIEAVTAARAGNYVFERHKPQHPGWILSWPVVLLLSMCADGNIYEAKRNPEYKEPK